MARAARSPPRTVSSSLTILSNVLGDDGGSLHARPARLDEADTRERRDAPLAIDGNSTERRSRDTGFQHDNRAAAARTVDVQPVTAHINHAAGRSEAPALPSEAHLLKENAQRQQCRKRGNDDQSLIVALGPSGCNVDQLTQESSQLSGVAGWPAAAGLEQSRPGQAQVAVRASKSLAAQSRRE